MSSCLRWINAAVLTWVESGVPAVFPWLDQLMDGRWRPGFVLSRAITIAP